MNDVNNSTIIPNIMLTRAMSDPALFGQTFKSPSFWTWRVVAKIIDGLPLTEPREVALFKECTGRTQLPNREQNRRLRRLILLVGRRGGKDRFLSAVAVWRAALCADWRKHISEGEQAVVLLLGADKKQAAILRRYCEGLLRAPLLKREITRQTNEVIEFRNGATLEVATNDARLVRGRSAIAVLGSECCHWKTDTTASSSDEEVVGAAEPSLSMCPDGGILCLGSSVYRKRGYMYRKFSELHGNDDSEDICWVAPSTVMNSKLPAQVVDAALIEDPAKAGAEFLGRWREDLSDFIPLDVIEACTDIGIRERPPQRDFSYFAHADAAGGTGQDSFALAIAHREADGIVCLDLVREYKPRFIPAAVIAELAPLLKSYRIFQVRGDSFSGGFHSSEWQRHYIQFTPCDGTTSENYLAALPMLLAGRARLLDNAVLRTQLAGLERRTQAGTRETVTHAAVASAHDDVATAAAGALVLANSAGAYNMDGFQPDYVDLDAPNRDQPKYAPYGTTDLQRSYLAAYMASGGWGR